MQPSENSHRRIGENWHRVVQQVEQACRRVGRLSSEVLIVGVCKYVGPELAAQLVQTGCRNLGENRPQSLWEKVEYFASQTQDVLGQVAWHQIGHLQRNKIRRTLPHLSYLHSLDSLRLAEALSCEAGAISKQLPVLVEVNVSRDASKSGVAASEIDELILAVASLPSLRLSGLMAMSSLGGSADTVRAEFAQVREMRDRLERQYAGRISLPELSLGMSGDFELAIAEGATMVRIGSSLWEGVITHD